MKKKKSKEKGFTVVMASADVVGSAEACTKNQYRHEVQKDHFWIRHKVTAFE